MEFNSRKLNEIRNDLTEALAAVEQKHGVSIGIGKMTYSDIQFTTTLTVTVGSSKSDAAKILWDANCLFTGLAKSDFGKCADIDGRTFRIIGIKPRARKYNIIVRDMGTGKEYVYTDGSILAYKRSNGDALKNY